MSMNIGESTINYLWLIIRLDIVVVYLITKFVSSPISFFFYWVSKAQTPEDNDEI